MVVNERTCMHKCTSCGCMHTLLAVGIRAASAFVWGGHYNLEGISYTSVRCPGTLVWNVNLVLVHVICQFICVHKVRYLHHIVIDKIYNGINKGNSTTIYVTGPKLWPRTECLLSLFWLLWMLGFTTVALRRIAHLNGDEKKLCAGLVFSVCILKPLLVVMKLHIVTLRFGSTSTQTSWLQSSQWLLMLQPNCNLQPAL